MVSRCQFLLSFSTCARIARRGIVADPGFTLAGYLRRRHASAALPLPPGERLDAPLTDSLLLVLNAAKPPLLLDPEGEAPGLMHRAISVRRCRVTPG
jgi:hypothetical protein